jgi:hypothetical protein
MLREQMRFIHHSWHCNWPMRPDLCACDADFCQYLQERNIRRKSIFHFGTGGHHVVGVRNQELGLENEVLGITVAPSEHAQYVKDVIRTPSLGRHYRVWFADIYDLTSACLPTFDVVTLFHLYEFTDATSVSRRLADAGVLDLFLSKLAPEGRLLFYEGSFAYAKTARLLERVAAEGRMSLLERYKSLLVYQVSAQPREPHPGSK